MQMSLLWDLGFCDLFCRELLQNSVPVVPADGESEFVFELSL